jgi:hypothetical protein
MLTIGALTLTPTFDGEVYEYTASTVYVTNKITAAAANENAVIAITVNGEEHANGTAYEWRGGANTVVITVTNGTAAQDYTVIVTQSYSIGQG